MSLSVAVTETWGASCRAKHAASCPVEQLHAELGVWTVSSYIGPVGPHATFPPRGVVAVVRTV